MLLRRVLLVFSLFLLLPIKVYANDKLNVFVSILPQQYFVEKIGGEHIDVHVMVGPGQSPATYEPTTRQMAVLSNADLYFGIGVPFESAWLDKIKQNNDKLKVVECCETIAHLDAHDHDHGHGHHHDLEYDPHIWTNPKKVILLVELIKNELAEIDTENNASYSSAAESFIKELQALDVSIRNKTKDLKKRDLIVSHPSWSYFAAEYDFTQTSIEQQGKEIQASSMMKLIKIVKERNVKAIFSQPQFNDKAAEIIANEVNAEVIDLDPLAFDYIKNMNQVADNIVRGLSHEQCCN